MKSHPARSRSEKAKPRIPLCKVTNARRCLDFDNNETHDGRNARNLAERVRTSAILELWNYKWFMGNCLTPPRLQGILKEPQWEGEKCLLTYATKQTLMAIKFSRNKTPCKSLKPYNILWIEMTCYYVEWIFVIFELCVISSKACFGCFSNAGKHHWLSRQVVTTEVTSWPGSANFQEIQHVLG